MMTKEVRARVIELLSEIAKKDPKILEDNYQSKEMWDSFTKVDIVFSIEEEFSVQLTPEEIGRLASPQSVVEIVEGHLV